MSLGTKSAPAAIAAAASSIYEAYQPSRTCAPIRSGLVEGDIDGAYAVQEANTSRWISEGRRLVGRKIGMTSRIVQEAAGIYQPDYGMLFADMEVLSGEIVPLSSLKQPKAEGEVAFVVERAIENPDATLVEVMKAVAFVLPALEIVDSRITNFDCNILDTIADNASSGLYALGVKPMKLSDIDLLLCGMVLERNGSAVAFGTGAACLGHPLHSLRWLARKMASVGRPLQAGDTVLSGALGPIVTMQPGDFVETKISGLGSVSIGFGTAA